jgi:predicted metal-dependent phosphoesterase TrpH
MKELRADLHLHTCLSPCAEPEMVPTAIVEEAKQAGLDMIGICDHNSAENVHAVIKAGERESLPIIPGMEITSREEVHILGLFQDEGQLLHVQDLVYDRLAGENDADLFGPQTIVDDSDNELRTTARLLIGATSLTLEETVNAIHDHGGLAIAAHIDRERFGLVGQLGFIPDGLQLDAVEVSPTVSLNTWDDKPVVRFSDAHSLKDIGSSVTRFLLEAATVEEIAKALKDADGRRIVSH